MAKATSVDVLRGHGVKLFFLDMVQDSFVQHPQCAMVAAFLPKDVAMGFFVPGSITDYDGGTRWVCGKLVGGWVAPKDQDRLTLSTRTFTSCVGYPTRA